MLQVIYFPLPVSNERKTAAPVKSEKNPKLREIVHRLSNFDHSLLKEINPYSKLE